MLDGPVDPPLRRGEERAFRMGVCPVWADLRIATHVLAVAFITGMNVAGRTRQHMLGRCAPSAVARVCGAGGPSALPCPPARRCC